jgi:hypothetical protein
MTEKRKLCPLLMMGWMACPKDFGKDAGGICCCKKEKCAWWYENYAGCSVWVMARELDGIEEKTT